MSPLDTALNKGASKLADLPTDALKDLQGLLKQAGFDVSVDGKYGDETAQALAKFKANVYLANPDMVGLSTLGKLRGIIDTGPGSNPQVSPKDPNTRPKPPEPTYTFKVPGITHRLSSDTSIFYNGKPTHFTWGEATKNGDRIPVSSSITTNVTQLAAYMDGVRSHLGNRPIGITSWYRDPETNRNIGGARQSQHLVGNAVDFYVVGESVVDTFYNVKNYVGSRGGLAVGSGFVHIDIRGYYARWRYPGGPNVSLN